MKKTLYIFSLILLCNSAFCQMSKQIIDRLNKQIINNQSVPSSSTVLLGWWTFDYPAGYYKDESTNGNSLFAYGPVQSNITYAAGNTAPYYDGINDFMQSDNSFPDEWNTNNGETVSIWFKTPTTTNFASGGVGGSGLYCMYPMFLPGVAYYVLWTGVDTIDKFCFTDAIYANANSTNQWTTNWCNWISCVKTGRVTFWIDGIQKYNAAYTAANPSNICTLFLGERISYGYTEGYIGRVDAWATGMDNSTASNIFFNQIYPSNQVLSVKFTENPITNIIKDMVSSNDFIIQPPVAWPSARNSYMPRWKADGSYEFQHDNNILTNNGVYSFNNNNWSISFWLKPTSVSAQTIYTPITFMSNTSIITYIRTGGSGVGSLATNYSISIVNATSQNSSTESGTFTNTNTNVWNHIAITVQSSPTTNILIYLNGTNLPLRTAASFYTPLKGTITKIQICGGDISNPYKGSFDDFRLYSGILSSNEIFDLSIKRF